MAQVSNSAAGVGLAERQGAKREQIFAALTNY